MLGQVCFVSSTEFFFSCAVLLNERPVLHASWILLFVCSFFEVSRGNLRKRVDTGWGSCTCIPFFGICKRRGFRKWGKSEGDRDVDKVGEKEGERIGRTRRRRDEEENSRSRSRKASRRR